MVNSGQKIKKKSNGKNAEVSPEYSFLLNFVFQKIFLKYFRRQEIKIVKLWKWSKKFSRPSSTYGFVPCFRIFKLTPLSVQENINLLHASVLSMVEFDDDIFAAGHCFDWNQYSTKKGLYCPFAHRLPPPEVASLAKDLASEYHYLGNTSEWFFLARKNAERVIAKNEQYIKGN